MRESFVFDREKLYGFDYENKIADTWVQDFEAANEIAFEEISEEATKRQEVEIVDEGLEEILEINVKEAFFEFARGPVFRPPHQVQPHPMPVVPPRPPQVQPHPMPTIPPRPQPPRPGHGHNFNPHSGAAPRFAPPAYVPQRAPGLRAVDPGSISRCLYSNTYVWLSNRQDFWFFPTFIGRRSIAGYRWMHRNWVYMGFSLGMIDSFFCGGR